MQAQFGTQSLVAQFLGFLSGTTLVSRASQNCVVTRLGVGQYYVILNQANAVTSGEGNAVDDATYAVHVEQYGSTAAPNVTASNKTVQYGTPAADAILITFGTTLTPADPTSSTFVFIQVFQVTDGINNFPNTPLTGNP
jgi:hypothetical protein